MKTNKIRNVKTTNKQSGSDKDEQTIAEERMQELRKEKRFHTQHKRKPQH
jgi:hypothetical protein